MLLFQSKLQAVLRIFLSPPRSYHLFWISYVRRATNLSCAQRISFSVV
ncbi:unnamed protein product [Amoebophrya sp. A120]|nr:unnamed protein product [Amoebophrya sp. A120]|eukprot:GSA120T00025117001.1